MSYQFLGCYNDSTTARALNGSYTQFPSTDTNEVCVQNCAQQGFIYAGTEYSYECMCSNVLNNGAVIQSATDCNMLCAGSSTEYCGAGNRLTLYQVGNQSLSVTTMTATTTSSTVMMTTTTSSATSSTSSTSSPPASSAPIMPATIASSGSTYHLLGCYNDTVAARAMNGSYTQYTSTNTNEICVQNCASQKFEYAATEYGYECFCSHTLNNNAIIQSTSDCNMLCPGSSTEYCGAGNRLTMYSINAPGSLITASNGASYHLLGCYNDTVTARALNGSYTQYRSTNTNEVCVQNCAQQGFIYAGTEYSYECLCSNVLNNGAVIQPATDCNMACAGSSTENCGAGNRLSLYQLQGSAPGTVSTSSTSISTSSSPTTSSTTSTRPSPTVTPFAPKFVNVSSTIAYQLRGCYNDTTAARAMNGSYTQFTSKNTNEVCVAYCSQQNFEYSASEYSYECFCSNYINNYATLQPITDCNMTCAGNASEFCGAGNRLSMYQLVPATST